LVLFWLTMVPTLVKNSIFAYEFSFVTTDKSMYTESKESNGIECPKRHFLRINDYQDFHWWSQLGLSVYSSIVIFETTDNQDPRQNSQKYAIKNFYSSKKFSAQDASLPEMQYTSTINPLKALYKVAAKKITLQMKAITCLPPYWFFLLWAKMNRAQRRVLL